MKSGNLFILFLTIFYFVASREFPLNSKSLEKKTDDKPEDALRCRNNPDVTFTDITLETVTLEPDNTKYSCRLLNFEETIYVVGFEMILENSNVMHHWLLSECQNGTNLDESKPKQDDKCRINMQHICPQFISAWNVGNPLIDCLSQDTFIEMGPNGTKTIFLQVHYFNQNSTLLEETPKFRVYTTKKKRKYHVGMLLLGTLNMEIPPGQPRHEERITISPNCSQILFNQKIYILKSFVHMHKTGIGGKLSIRNKNGIKDLIDNSHYEYDKQKNYFYDEPIEFDPGDEMQSSCFYNTTQSNDTLHFGYSLQQEMCITFIRYYPLEAVTDPKLSHMFGDISICEARLHEGHVLNGSIIYFSDCNATQFIEEVYQPNKISLENHCDPRLAYCSQSCRETLKRLINHPCMHGEAYEFLVYYLEKEFYYYEEMVNIQSRMLSCMKMLGQNYL